MRAIWQVRLTWTHLRHHHTSHVSYSKQIRVTSRETDHQWPGHQEQLCYTASKESSKKGCHTNVIDCLIRGFYHHGQVVNDAEGLDLGVCRNWGLFD